MIQVLPKNVADKIAAGEVIDRPVSIVKELVENALDAGAGTITVEIRNGGRTYIRVADDGCGIPKEEAATAFLRHATSKVTDAEDLLRIRTLGFRGEALASIAAVSRTEMITKTARAAAGISLRIEGGEIAGITDIGCPDGTSVIVSDLFYNTPARLKFMKADGTESAQIIDLVSKMALAYSRVKIRMISNGSILFSTAGKGNTHANIIEIFGKEIGAALIHYCAGESDTGKVDAEVFVSPQNHTRSSKKHQVFFVNGRYINSKLLENVVAHAYRERIPAGRFPVVFLFYQADPGSLDVNIHPNKKEVRFADEKSVLDFMTRTIIRALDTTGIMPDIKMPEQAPAPGAAEPPLAGTSPGVAGQPAGGRSADLTVGLAADEADETLRYADQTVGIPAAKAASQPAAEEPPEKTPPTDLASFFAQKRAELIGSQEEKEREREEEEQLQAVFLSETVRETADPYGHTASGDTAKTNLSVSHADTVGNDGSAPQSDASFSGSPSPYAGGAHAGIAAIQVTGAIFHTYITGYDTKYFYLIDQHAAHERIFYEELLRQFHSEAKAHQSIIEPILIETPAVMKEERSALLDNLQKFGFVAEAFGGKVCKVSAIPAYMSMQEAEDFLRDFMDQADEQTDFSDWKKIEKITTRACKSAVKAHDKLSLAEMKQLLIDLAKTENPYSCPHGRPVFLKLGKQQIERMFRRA